MATAGAEWRGLVERVVNRDVLAADSLSDVWTRRHVLSRTVLRAEAMPTDELSSSSRFDSLYRAYADAIRGYCIRRLGVEDAADATADVFVVVWHRLLDCPEGDEARPWIYGVARNIVSNRRRAGERSVALLRAVQAVSAPDQPGPESLAVRRAEYRELDKALAKLPSRYREALILAEWDGLDRETIARIEGVSRAAIDQRISRAYRKLARLMDRSMPGDQKDQAFEVSREIREGS